MRFFFAIPSNPRRQNYRLFELINGNLLASLFAFNLIRDLQMQLESPQRRTTRKRPALWAFEQVETVRRTILQRAGRISHPSGKLVLTFCAGKNLKQRVLQIFEALAA